MTLLDQRTQRSSDTQIEPVWTEQVIPNETETVLFNQGGRWQRLTLPGLVKEGEGKISQGVHNYVNALSPSGRYISFNNAGDAVMLWRTDKSGEAPYDPELTGRTSGGSPQALALSWDGKRTAIADTGTIYVSDTVPGPKPAGTPLALTGNDQINSDVVPGGGGALRFFGDNDHLLSASGDTLAVWDLTQHSLISGRMSVTVDFACNACPGPQVSVSPDGKKAGVVDGNQTSATVRQLKSPGWETVLKDDFLQGTTYSSLFWGADGKKLLVQVRTEQGGQVFDVRSGDRRAALLGRWGPSSEQSEPKESTGQPVLSGDGRHIVMVGVDGAKTVIRNSATGAVERVVPAQSGVKDTIIEGDGAVNADATALATTIPDGDGNGAMLAKLVSLEDGRSRTIGSGPADAALFSGEHLLIQRSSGVLEVWDTSGTHLQRSIAGEPGYVTGPVANRQGTLAARERSDGTVAITDLESGETLGSFPPPGRQESRDGVRRRRPHPRHRDRTGRPGEGRAATLDPIRGRLGTRRVRVGRPQPDRCRMATLRGKSPAERPSLRLTPEPLMRLADHIDSERPTLIYRSDDEARRLMVGSRDAPNEGFQFQPDPSFPSRAQDSDR
jgi:hypothetical protein